jgi:hypothetical protein
VSRRSQRLFRSLHVRGTLVQLQTSRPRGRVQEDGSQEMESALEDLAVASHGEECWLRHTTGEV